MLGVVVWTGGLGAIGGLGAMAAALEVMLVDGVAGRDRLLVDVVVVGRVGGVALRMTVVVCLSGLT